MCTDGASPSVSGALVMNWEEAEKETSVILEQENTIISFLESKSSPIINSDLP